MLYETVERANVLNGSGKPVNLQVGHGTAVMATVKNYGPGNVEKTENPLDFAINGEGFFTVQGPKGDVVYTRDGSFKISVADEGKKLTTADGYSVLDEPAMKLYLDPEVDLSRLSVGDDGSLSYVDNTGVSTSLEQKIGIVKFANRYALESIGNNFYAKNSATGEPVNDWGTGIKKYYYPRLPRIF